MRGPAPKSPKMRQRRNKASTAAALSSSVAAAVSVEIPKCPDGKWHPGAVAWWKEVWSSPMVAEYTNTDRQELMKLLRLENDFHQAEKPRERLSLLAEIRLQRQCFGRTAMDRRRLNWSIESPKSEKPAVDEAENEKDDRDFLRDVH